MLSWSVEDGRNLLAENSEGHSIHKDKANQLEGQGMFRNGDMFRMNRTGTRNRHNEWFRVWRREVITAGMKREHCNICYPGD